MPREHASADDREANHAGHAVAFAAALAGFLLATVVYGMRTIDAETFAGSSPRSIGSSCTSGGSTSSTRGCSSGPCLGFARVRGRIDRQGIDWLADGLARLVRRISQLDDWIDRLSSTAW